MAKDVQTKKELLRTVKYALVATSAGIIQFGSYALLFEYYHLEEWISYAISLTLSVLWNFTINRNYTFRSAANVKKAMLLVAAYYAVFAPLTTWLEKWLTLVHGWSGFLVTALNMLLNVTTEFPYQRFFVFRDSLDTLENAKQ